MAQRRNILFFTNSDFGQANVVLAVAYELLLRNEFDIHIASWTPLESRVIELSQQVQNEVPNTTIYPIKFHTLPLNTMFDSYVKNIGEKADLPHPPGANGAERLTQLAPNVLAVWKPEEHIELYDWCADLVGKLNPSLVIVEPLLGPALDMVKTLKLKYAVLSPCTLALGLIPEQPWGAGFWKYPALSTGFPYPLPWSKILENLYCTWAVIKCLWQPRVKKLNAARNAHGIYGPLPTLTPWVKDVPHVSPSLPEIDLPMVIPSNVHYCGPILLATTPISQSDPELLNWLQNKPTVLLALGTHHEARADVVREIALGLRILLEARPDVQVLWKLKAEKQAEEEDKQTVNAILSKELAEARVRIEGWLKADPVAIMESGNIICSVHHGGANSYFGTCWAGIPQVILAPWYDTYDYATRVEYLGIGVYGNDKAGHEAVVDMSNYKSPLMIDGEEFGAALLKAIGKEKGGAEAIRTRASELGEMCRKSGGRVQAAKIFSDLALN